MHIHITYFAMDNLDKTAFNGSASYISDTSCSFSPDLDSSLLQTIGQRVDTYLSLETIEMAASGCVAVSLILSVAFLVRSLALLVEKAGD